jgi:DNA-binding SARP family transcriptional activator
MRGQVRMLGALQVAIEDRPVKIASPRERVVFAGLAIRAGETASHDQLCRALWGEDWSRKRDGAYRPAVSRLRKTLGTDGLVVRESFGYRLDTDPGDVDLLAFEALAGACGTAASPAEWQRTLELLTRAAALWRGTPFADIASDHLRREHRHRLEAQFSLVRAKRIEAVVRVCPPRAAAEALHDLESLIRENPGDEHLRWLLMLALYRSGRQTEALAAFREAWRYCDRKLGVRPGQDLQNLNKRMLSAAPGLTKTPYTD